MKTTRTLAAATSGIALAGLTALAMAPGAFAADTSGVDVTNTETVQVYVNADGSIASKKVYEQLTMTGNGPVELSNPIEQSGLRNLDGFSGLSVEDGVQRVNLDVDGMKQLRSVSNYTGDLPLDVSVSYRLDGKTVQPDDVVGADGQLEVIYTVKNITAQPQEVSFPDGKGGETTETVDVPIPVVGSLTTVAPSNFTDVKSDSANMAGDGKGGTKLSFTMTLFPPIGSDTAEFSYTATIEDGVVPASNVTALPVNPLDVPTFKSAGASYQSGSDTGVKLAEGATTIDTNLLKLRDGAAKLLAGLIKLSDGADQLNAGLAGEAAPGAQKLADGAGELNDGLGQINDGAGKLSDGAGQLSDGTGKLDDGATKLAAGAGKLDDGASQLSDGAGQLADGAGAAVTGSKKLEDGLKLISGGLGQLSGVDGLPKALDGVTNELKPGVDALLAGVGDTATEDTLLWGLNKLELGLADAEDGSAALLAGVEQLRGDGSADTPGLVAAKGGVDQVQAGLAEAVKTGGSIDQLIGGLNSLLPFCDTDEPACSPTVNALIAGAQKSKTDLSAANQGLLQVAGGLATAIGALDTKLIPGLTELNGGITTAKNGAVDLNIGANRLRLGLLLLKDGVNKLEVGLTDAVAGVGKLSVGASDAYTGSGDLADGLSQIDVGANRLDAGAGKLAAGTGELRSGAGQLADGAGQLDAGAQALAAGALKLFGGTGDAAAGSQQIADGAAQLADGLGDAADGSGRLADGLAEAAGGAPKLVDGAGRLSDEGMSQLIAAGEDTAQDYGKLYATMEAGAERADAQKMAYGAPEGAKGLTAYSFELLGDDGEGSRNTKRGVLALGLLGLGGGAFLLRRRFI